MTTKKPVTPVTHKALQRAARAMTLAAILRGLARWLALYSGLFFLLILADSVLNMPPALRLPLVLTWAGFLLYDFSRHIFLPLVRPITAAQAARILEIEQKIAGNVLINAYQFERDPKSALWLQFIGSTLASSESLLKAIRPGVLWRTKSLRKWLLAGLVVAGVAGASFIEFPRYLAHSFSRVIMPLADIPPIVNWELEVTPKGPVNLVEGDRLEISVHVTSLVGNAAPPVPEVIWKPGSASFEPNHDDGESEQMVGGGADSTHDFTFCFDSVSQSFSFRVWVDDAYSPAVQVQVEPLPRTKSSTFSITPPVYTGLKTYLQPGPPADLQVLAGSTVTANLELLPESPAVIWKEKEGAKSMDHSGSVWSLTAPVTESRFYTLLTTIPDQKEPRVLCQGQISAVADRPPEVEFITKERNLLVNPGDTVPLTIKATDDYGVSSIKLVIAPGDDPTSDREIKAWNYAPWGEKEPAPESYSLVIDPQIFTPGSTFLLTAQANDFSQPDATHPRSTSRPIVLRVASIDDLNVPEGDVLEPLVSLLKTTIIRQTKANGLTDNLAVHLSEAIAKMDLPQHHGVMAGAESEAHQSGSAAIDEATKHPEAKAELFRLQNVVNGEMTLAQGDIDRIMKVQGDDLPLSLITLQKRQTFILSELMALLGQIVNDRQKQVLSIPAKPELAPPAVTSAETLAKLKDDLKSFLDKQKRIIDATKSLTELNPEDLTKDQEALLGEMAREEANQAKFFQDKLTDLSKLPLQDFGDGKLVSDANEVYQEVQAATQALYQKRPEIAVPNQTEAIENAAKIEQNLEKWLPNTVDNTKWLMEEAQSQKDVALAELPKQLDDVIGDLMQSEENLDQQDEQDPANSAMDSLDKGAGWGAADGPIPNMSAKGVTGNQLPKNDEISGRSGEGRNGRSDGQMVGDTAVGKGGKETPTRLTSTPFEPGSVNDTSTDTKGGATGGGKLSGSGQDGLRGPLPPAVLQRLAYVADQQSKLRQQAESLDLQLRKQRKPTGDLESALTAMKQMQDAAQKQDGLGVLQAYHQTLDALASARSTYSGDRVSRVEINSLQPDSNGNISETEAEQAPAGYEEMTGAYFRSLSESSDTPPATTAPSK